MAKNITCLETIGVTSSGSESSISCLVVLAEFPIILTNQRQLFHLQRNLKLCGLIGGHFGFGTWFMVYHKIFEISLLNSIEYIQRAVMWIFHQIVSKIFSFQRFFSETFQKPVANMLKLPCQPHSDFMFPHRTILQPWKLL